VLIAQFPTGTGSAEPDFYRDRLGVRTRMTSMLAVDMQFAGTVRCIQGTDVHDGPEWAGILGSVLDPAMSGKLTLVALDGHGGTPLICRPDSAMP
jgi:hypothetical protein